MLLFFIFLFFPFIFIFINLARNSVSNKFIKTVGLWLGCWILLFFICVILMISALILEKIFGFKLYLIFSMLICSCINYFFIFYIIAPKMIVKYFTNELEMYMNTSIFFIFIILIIIYSIIINIFMSNINNLKNISRHDKEALRSYLHLDDCYSFEPIYIEKSDLQEKSTSIEYYISKDEYKEITSEIKRDAWNKEEYKDGYICRLTIQQKDVGRILYELSMKIERKKVILFLLYIIGLIIIDIFVYRVIFKKNNEKQPKPIYDKN